MKESVCLMVIQVCTVYDLLSFSFFVDTATEISLVQLPKFGTGHHYTLQLYRASCTCTTTCFVQHNPVIYEEIRILLSPLQLAQVFLDGRDDHL